MTRSGINRYSLVFRVFGFVAVAATLSFWVFLSSSHAREAQHAAQDQEMDMQFALRHAYRNNPVLIAARSELKATHELLPQAYAGWKPTISSEASLTNTEIDGSNFGGGDGSTARDLVLSLDQPLWRGGRTFAQTAAARHTIRAQGAALRSTEQSVLLDAAAAYMDVVRDQALLDLSLGNQDVIAKQLEATQDRFDVGEITITDVSQAKARLARAESDVITARGDLHSSYAVFEELIGLTPKRLAGPDMALTLPESLDEAVLVAEQSNPRILAAFHSHKASEEDVDDVFGELLPEIGAFGSWNKTYDPSPGLIDEQTTKSIGLSASIPLYQAGAVRSRVRQAKHTANQRYIEILDVKRQVRQEVISAWSDWRAAQSEINSRSAQVEASQVAQEGVRAEATVGSRTVLDTLDADQELLDAQVALVTARRNEVVARFTLLSTLGLLSPQTLGFGEEAQDYARNLNNVSRKIFDMHVDRVQEVD